MSSIDDIKAKLSELTDVVNAFEMPTTAGITADEVAKVEGEIEAVDAELKADEAVA